MVGHIQRHVYQSCLLGNNSSIYERCTTRFTIVIGAEDVSSRDTIPFRRVSYILYYVLYNHWQLSSDESLWCLMLVTGGLVKKMVHLTTNFNLPLSSPRSVI
jgi:hypothetical protein